jgi:hypothetical protein
MYKTRSSNQSFYILVLMLLAVMAAAGAVLFDYDSFGGAIVFGVGIITVFALIGKRLTPKEDRSFILGLAVAGLVTKLLFSLLRLSVTEQIWGLQDAAGYNRNGELIAQAIRAGRFSEVIESYSATSGAGTAGTSLLTGIVYSVFGESLTGGFLFFAFIAFIGALCFIRAVYLVVPGRQHRLYAFLIFFFPTILFWPSSLGKDAIQFGFAGVATLGFAIALTRSRLWGAVLILLGIGGVYLVRPEVAVAIPVAMVIGFLLRKPRANMRDIAIKAVSIGIFLALGLLLKPAIETTIGVDELSFTSVQEKLEDFASNPFSENDVTADGNIATTSDFDAVSPSSPSWVPMAFLTVLFRPFIWEANSAQTLLQSLEGLLTLALVAYGARNIVRTVAATPNSAFLIYSLVFMITMVLILSTFGNFGLLARQRAIVFPMVFLFAAGSAAYQRRATASASEPASPVPVTNRAESFHARRRTSQSQS